MKKVYISVINYNSRRETIECLKSLDDLKVIDLIINILVADNASINVLKINPADFKTPVKVIINDRNLGFSGGHNANIKLALDNNADYVLILNNDTRVDKDLIAQLLTGFKDNNTGIVVPKIYFEKNYEYHKDKYKSNDLGKVIWYAGGILDWENVVGKNRGVDEVDKNQFNNICDTDIATGCCMLVKKEVFNEIGYFDERYFLYYEDTDFSMRVKNAGYKIIYQPKAILWHKNAGSAGGSGSEIQDYFISRNRMIFGLKYASSRSKLALLRESISLLLQGRHWQKQGIKDFYLRKFGKGSYDL